MEIYFATLFRNSVVFLPPLPGRKRQKCPRYQMVVVTKNRALRTSEDPRVTHNRRAYQSKV